MKKLTVILGLVLVMCLLVLVSCAAPPAPAPVIPTPPTEPAPVIPTPPTEPAPEVLTTQGYVYDDKFGYGFEYPGGWELCWELCVEEGDFPKGIKKVISLKKEIPKDEVICRVELGLVIKSATDLQEVRNELKKEQEISNTPILNETTISINNMNGYDILFGIPTWKLRQVVFFDNGMAYILKYSSPEEFYHMYEETFNNVINSFVIK